MYDENDHFDDMFDDDERDFDEAEDMEEPMDLEDRLDRLMDFAEPGGNSALRAASERNPRNLPCPDCGAPNRLTPRDRDLGYCCNACADRNEGGGF